MPKAVEQSTVNVVRPTFVLRLCIGCGAQAAWRYDRKRRPYHYCPNCGIRFWIYHPKAMAGIELVHAMVLRAGVQQFRKSVAMTEMRRMVRTPMR